MLACPNCAGTSKVVNSRPSSDRILRRRECLTCKERWSTYEIDSEVYAKLMKWSAKLAEIEFQAWVVS